MKRKEARSVKSVVRTTRAKSRAAATAPTGGMRLGTHRRDMRWQDPTGNVWASKFEYQVYLGLKERGYNVRRTTTDHTMAYTSPVQGGKCLQCNSGRVVHERNYTPDLFILPKMSGDSDEPVYYIEAKGYLRAPQRALLRYFRAQRPDIDLRLIIQRDYKVGKSSLVGWATKYLKAKVHIWNGDIPNDWVV